MDEVWQNFQEDRSVQTAFTGNRDRTRRFVDGHGEDALVAMRGIVAQAPLPERFHLSAEGADTADALALLHEAPHGSRARPRDPDEIDLSVFEPSPRVSNLIGWWAATFGAYEKTGHVSDILVYLPVVDYEADPMVEKALSVEVDFRRSETQSGKLSIKLHNVGLTSGASRSMIVDTHVAPRHTRFQVAVPVELELVEYKDQATGDLRHTARVTHFSPPVPLTPEDGSAFVTVLPRSKPLLPVLFLGGASADSTTLSIEKSRGIEATAEHDMTEKIKLGLEYSCSANSRISVKALKNEGRSDRLHLHQWPGAEGYIRISAAR